MNEATARRLAERDTQWQRERIEERRRTEDYVLAEAARLDPADRSWHADWVRELATQVRDARAAGRYTTIGG